MYSNNPFNTKAQKLGNIHVQKMPLLVITAVTNRKICANIAKWTKHDVCYRYKFEYL